MLFNKRITKLRVYITRAKITNGPLRIVHCVCKCVLLKFALSILFVHHIIRYRVNLPRKNIIHSRIFFGLPNYQYWGKSYCCFVSNALVVYFRNMAFKGIKQHFLHDKNLIFQKRPFLQYLSLKMVILKILCLKSQKHGLDCTSQEI